MWAKLGTSLSFVLLSGYIISLWLGGNLSAYIHPRYHLFTVIMIALCGMAALIDIIHTLYRHHRALRTERPTQPDIVSSIVIIVLLLGIILPPQSLSLHAATTRARDTNDSLPFAPTQTAACHPPETGQQGNTLLYRWLSAVHACATPDDFVGEAITMVGFITEQPDDLRSFYLTRFLVSCCAVDSTPLRVRVIAPTWRTDHTPGQWLRVEGKVAKDRTGALVITDATLTPINQPASPYEFLGSLE
ncbi:MAG: TIGR03943 family protein [Candidatus Saccharibacteria bacterium]|nr:TIGR03943 family protein [Candidatus Saccharibacteria bacterium]